MAEVMMRYESMSENGKADPARHNRSGPQDGDDALWRIGDVAREFGLTLRTLRFYEDKGLISPKRVGSTRLYSRRDKARLKLILTGRKVGFSVREIKQMIDLYNPVGSNTRQLRVALEKAGRQMDRLLKQRDAVEDAIAELSHTIDIVRDKLASASGKATH